MKTVAASLIVAALSGAVTRPPVPAHSPLPGALTLQYTLHAGKIVLGQVTKTLKRQKDGDYYHSTWTRPAGLAKVFTNVQFVEQGIFALHGRVIRPLRFADTKTGDGHDYRRQVVFDYRSRRLIFAHAPARPMPPGSQDLNTVFYLFMLHPVEPGMVRKVYVTNGKTIKAYWFVYRRTTVLATPWGRLKTYVVSRLSRPDWQAAKQCRTATPACRARFHDFRIWVAPSLQDIPVRLQQHQHGHVLTLTITGLSRS
ncbi:MAG: DUF3108 domain-containing protein [Acidiferrobacteraceae bacterium]